MIRYFRARRRGGQIADDRIELSELRAESLRIHVEYIEGEKPWKFEGEKNNMTDAEQAAFMDSIRKGEPINNSNYMCLSTLLGIMAQMAIYSGQMIEWDKVLQSKRVLTPPDLSLTSDPPVKLGPDNMYPAPMPGKAEFDKWQM